jgi:thiopurine S-methyltransferase
MDPAFWRSRWQDRQIGFHEGKPNAFLSRFAERLTGRVLVPLCGKSEDLAYLESLGHEVVGIELAESAVREFYSDHPGTSVQIINSDLFAVTPAQVGRIDSIYDRAALIALPPQMRVRYAAHLQELAPAARMLLVTLEYPEGTMAGPPFSVLEDEVRSLYKNAPIELLDQGDDPRGRAGVVERVYFTAPRPQP